jgi:hypothetical protein
VRAVAAVPGVRSLDIRLVKIPKVPTFWLKVSSVVKYNIRRLIRKHGMEEGFADLESRPRNLASMHAVDLWMVGRREDLNLNYWHCINRRRRPRK